MLSPLLLAVCLTMAAGPARAVGRPAIPSENSEPDQRNEQLEQKIDEIDKQLDHLEKTLKGARKEAQSELKKKIPELRLKEEQLKNDIVRLRDSGQKAWKELEATLAEMQRAIERTQKED
jgi:septal ring factor EnvC (AmiA/AmiB activator)